MRRTIQCNGIRTIGTIVRRFIQFVWQKIFTKDCDTDSKATRKFSLTNQFSSLHSVTRILTRLGVGTSQLNERTNQRMNKEEQLNQTKSQTICLCLCQFSLDVFFRFSGHAHTQQNRIIIISFIFRLQKSFKEQRNSTRLYIQRGSNLAFSVNCRSVCISMSFEFEFKIVSFYYNYKYFLSSSVCLGTPFPQDVFFSFCMYLMIKKERDFCNKSQNLNFE